MRRLKTAQAQHGAEAGSTREAADKIAQYARRLPDEVATWLMRDMARQYPQAASLPAFQAWQNAQR